MLVLSWHGGNRIGCNINTPEASRKLAALRRIYRAPKLKIAVLSHARPASGPPVGNSHPSVPRPAQITYPGAQHRNHQSCGLGQVGRFLAVATTSPRRVVFTLDPSIPSAYTGRMGRPY
jgi:hypothetical protein